MRAGLPKTRVRFVVLRTEFNLNVFGFDLKYADESFAS